MSKIKKYEFTVTSNGEVTNKITDCLCSLDETCEHSRRAAEIIKEKDEEIKSLQEIINEYVKGGHGE